MPDPVFDVVVVGAGPAGCAAALAARRAAPGARVALVDAAAFPRDKACGDAVAAPALELLAGLGAPGAAAGYGPVGRVAVSLPGTPAVAGGLDVAARVVPRRVLDDRLRSAALAAGAEPVRLRVRAARPVTDGVAVAGGDGRRVVGRVVVAADGAASAVRRAVGLPRHPEPQTALALRAYADAPGLPDDLQLVELDAARWPAYTWAFPLADGSGRANVGWGTLVGRGLPRAAYAAALTAGLGRLLPGARVDPATVRGALLPLTPGRARQPDGPVLLAGDALGLVNPLTGEGILYAVLSGALAGTAAVGGGAVDGVTVGSGDPGRAYRRALAARLGRHWRHTGVAAAALRVPGLLAAGVRAGARDDAVVGDLLRLGLTDGLLTRRLVRGLATASVRRR